VAIYIGETSAWGKGVATDAIDLMCQHGFNRLGLHRIWSGTAETNTGMNRVFDKVGFQREGVFRDGMFLNGRFVNIICWSLLEGEKS
jgi:RimJ/RimL family protein N-acetyltransferase